MIVEEQVDIQCRSCLLGHSLKDILKAPTLESTKSQESPMGPAIATCSSLEVRATKVCLEIQSNGAHRLNGEIL